MDSLNNMQPGVLKDNTDLYGAVLGSLPDPAIRKYYTDFIATKCAFLASYKVIITAKTTPSHRVTLFGKQVQLLMLHSSNPLIQQLYFSAFVVHFWAQRILQLDALSTTGTREVRLAAIKQAQTMRESLSSLHKTNPYAHEMLCQLRVVKICKMVAK